MQEFKNEPKKHRSIITPTIFGNFKTALINFTCPMSPQICLDFYLEVKIKTQIAEIIFQVCIII